MRLTQYSDYALRIVMKLGAQPQELISIKDVASAYRISYHHLTKVANALVDLGVVESVRGRNGGLRLAMKPSDIKVGWLVRHTEPDLALVECFDEKTNGCPISPECYLRHALEHALRAFLDALDGYTVADLVRSPRHRERLVQLWRASA